MKQGLGRYLELARVAKTVDPGENSVSSSPTVPPSEGGAIQEVSATSIGSLLEDIVAASREVRNTVQNTIQDIESRNGEDPNFAIYADLARKTAFDATSLLTDPSAKPQRVDPYLLAAYEQDSYRRLLDPRAPYLTDLHRIDSDASASEFAVQRVWNSGKGPHTLWESLEDGPLVRFGLYKERQYLSMLLRQGTDIGNLSVPYLSRSAVLGVVRKLLERSGSDGQNLLGGIDDAIRDVRQWDLLFTRSQIRLNDSWCRFGDVLTSVMGDLRVHAGEKAARAQSAVLFGGLKTPVLTSTTRIDLDNQSEPIPDLSEFQNLLDGELFALMADVEDDLLQRERKALELEEARSVRQMNSRKVATAKQFSVLLGEAVKGLQGIKALSGSSLQNSSWINSFSDSLTTTADGLRTVIALSDPPKISL